jgi:hypothetical protein
VESAWNRDESQLAGFGGTKDLGLQSVSARQVNASNERSEAKKREGSGLRVGRLKSERTKIRVSRCGSAACRHLLYRDIGQHGLLGLSRA